MGWVILIACLGIAALGILFFQGVGILEERIRRVEEPVDRFETIGFSGKRGPKQLVLPFSGPLEPDLAYSRMGRIAILANVISGLLSRTHGS